MRVRAPWLGDGWDVPGAAWGGGGGGGDDGGDDENDDEHPGEDRKTHREPKTIYLIVGSS